MVSSLRHTKCINVNKHRTHTNVHHVSLSLQINSSHVDERWNLCTGIMRALKKKKAEREGKEKRKVHVRILSISSLIPIAVLLRIHFELPKDRVWAMAKVFTLSVHCAIDVNGRTTKISTFKQSKQNEKPLAHDLCVSTASHSIAFAPIIVLFGCLQLVANEWLLSRACTRFETNGYNMKYALVLRVRVSEVNEIGNRWWCFFIANKIPVLMFPCCLLELINVRAIAYIWRGREREMENVRCTLEASLNRLYAVNFVRPLHCTH